MQISDFDSVDEALGVADELIEQNKLDFGHGGGVLDHPNPLLKRYEYVQGHGKKRSWGVTSTSTLEQTCQPKSQKALTEMCATASGMLAEAPSGSGPTDSGVKVESPMFLELQSAQGELRSRVCMTKKMHPSRKMAVHVGILGIPKLATYSAILCEGCLNPTSPISSRRTSPAWSKTIIYRT